MSRHRRPIIADATRKPRYVAAAACCLLIVASVVYVVASLANGDDNKTPKPAPTVTKTVSLPQKTVTVVPKAADADALSQARRFKPLSKLAKGDRVINEQNPARPLCTFELWGGSIDKAVIQCGSSQQITVKTGFLTPVEVVQ